MIDKEKILNSQNVGLDLTEENNGDITSGYIHFEKFKNVDENREPKTTDKGSYIKTKFREFLKRI